MYHFINLENEADLHIQHVFNLIQQYQKNFKFFDLRGRESFNLRFIKDSINIPPDINIDNNTLKLLTKEKDLSRLRRYLIVIGHDDSSAQQVTNLLSLLESLKCKEIHLLDDMSRFMKRYHFIFNTPSLKEYPNEIIPNFLYLGSQLHALSKEIVNTLEITHICNVTRSASSKFPHIRYCRLYVEDNEKEDISGFFQTAFEFIQDAVISVNEGKKNKVLVHCAQGVSRSATIVIMFLMRSCGISLEQAYEFVKKQRNCIDPNEGFMKQLRKFDNSSHMLIRKRSSFCHFVKKPSI